MLSLSLDTLLNLLWAGIGVCALAGLAALEWRHYGVSGKRLRGQRLCAVLVATVCLFPAVSYSDDLISFSLLESRLGTRGGFGAPEEKPESPSPLTLARQLQSIEYCEVESPRISAPVFSRIGTTLCGDRASLTRSVCRASGRSPPAA